MSLAELLEPIANVFRGLGIPEPITHWGHPVMMGTVIFMMGTYVGWTGWRGRLAADKEVSSKNRADHRKLAPLMFLFLALGYTGGLLSLVMQKQPILESSHFWTGSILLGFLLINSVIAFTGFGKDNPSLRMTHAYLGTVALGLMLVHTFLGLQLGFSL
jgi:hypothetical protein